MDTKNMSDATDDTSSNHPEEVPPEVTTTHPKEEEKKPKEKKVRKISTEEIEEGILKFRKHAEALLPYTVILVALTYTFLGIEDLWIAANYGFSVTTILSDVFFTVIGIMIILLFLSQNVDAIKPWRNYVAAIFAIILGIYFMARTLTSGLGVTNFLVLLTGISVILVGILLFMKNEKINQYSKVIAAIGSLFLWLNSWASFGNISYFGIDGTIEGMFFFSLAVGLGLSLIIKKESSDIRLLFFVIAAFIYGLGLVALSINIYSTLLLGTIRGVVLPAPVGEFIGVIAGFVIVLNVIYFLLDIAYKFEVSETIMPKKII